MCSRYEAPTVAQLLDVFALKEPAKTEIWPGYHGPFIRSAAGGDGLEAHAGVFGLLPQEMRNRCGNRRQPARSNA